MSGTARSPQRTLSAQLGLIHNIAYYSREMRDFESLGLSEFWRAYVAWRCAPLGPVGPHTATAVLYNFAPAMVADALPSAWEATSPAAVLALRDDCLHRALERGLGDHFDPALLVDIADVLREAMQAADPAGRALFAAHADLPWPDAPMLQLWHACTLWREHRGDSHNIALAAAELSGLDAHVLLAARGVADAATIEKIRGWTGAQWADAIGALADRGLVTAEGESTEAGIEYRRAVERHTDELSSGPLTRLGTDGTQQLIELVDPIATHLVEVGAVAGRWPPPNPIARST